MSKILVDLMAGSLHVNLLELRQRSGEHIEQQGTSKVVKRGE